jgi:hypothetical protein
MGAIDNVKEVAKLVRELGNMELYRQILDLQGEIMELAQANRELNIKNHELEETLNKVGKMEFSSPFYYAEGDDIPHCPRCWEVDKKAVHYPPPRKSAAGPIYECHNCKQNIVHPRH